MSGAAIAAFSVSHQGLLAYQMGGGNIITELTWYNRGGARLAQLGGAATHAGLQLSPDHRYVAAVVMDDETGVGEIWTYDVARGVRSRFTHDPSETMNPQWSPDGSHIALAIRREIWSFDVARDVMTRVTFESRSNWPVWSPDSREIVFSSGWSSLGGAGQVFRTTTGGTAEAVPDTPSVTSPEARTILESG